VMFLIFDFSIYLPKVIFRCLVTRRDLQHDPYDSFQSLINASRAFEEITY